MSSSQVVTQSFLGFYKFQCSACRARCEYPLSTVYRVLYVILSASLLVAIAGAVAGTNLGTGCGCFSIGALIALALDFRVRARVKQAEANEKTRGTEIAATFR